MAILVKVPGLDMSDGRNAHICKKCNMDRSDSTYTIQVETSLADAISDLKSIAPHFHPDESKIKPL